MGMPKANIASTGIGVCVSHPVPIPVVVTYPAGAATVNSEGMMTLNQGSIGNASCGHTVTAMTFSATVFDEKLGCLRMGDTGMLPSGTATIMVGAMTVLAG